MIEILIVIIISGIVVGLAFEGVDIFRRYSRKVTYEIVKGNELLNMYLSLNTIISKSDSMAFSNESVRLYRKGSVFGKLEVNNSKLHLHFLNVNDTLPLNVESINVKQGELTDTLLLHTETITLIFYTLEQAGISTTKNNYYEDQSY